MSKLPADLMDNILSRLPVKTLLQWRSVSKLWCGLIDSPSFIKLHLNQSVKNDAYLSLVLNSNELYSSALDSLDCLVKLKHPFNSSDTPALLGSCNGLLLLSNKEEGIVLWNMSTRKYYNLPYAPLQFPPRDSEYDTNVTYGFGYDPVSDDYKAVRIVQFYYGELDSFSSDVNVYSLKSKSWRKVRDLPYFLCFSCEMGVFASSALHWPVRQISCPDMPMLVAAFDFGTEDFSLLPQPEFGDEDFDMHLDVLGGCICITCSDDNNGSVDIWVMKEYGVKGSWTKLSVVIPPRAMISRYLKPLAYSKGADEILLNWDGERFYWYNLARKTFKEARISGLPFSCYVPYSKFVVVSVGSLVPLEGFGHIERGKQPSQEKKKGQQNRKQRDHFLSKGFKLVL